MRKTIGPTGALRLAADPGSGSGAGPDGHADRFWAGALACAAAAPGAPVAAGVSVGEPGAVRAAYAPAAGGGQ